ncbi:hypothetical protein [Leeuwenhoekiella sp. CH_XMU1409-2]|uniref:hypothetical protein n=1 Tax=Leeuwenhoekiella sp. CH_XMU1409-2 TaxID=3107768 RepID=UPI0030099B51
MRVFTLCFLLFALALSASAQDVKPKDRLTQEENETWLQKYQQLDDSEEKLKMIKAKILYDAQFVGPRPGISLTGLNEAQRQALKERESKKPKVTADCKILFVLQTTQSHFLDLEKSPQYKAFVEHLETFSISDTILTGASASAIYGTRARCGVVLLKTEDPDALNYLKTINNQK